MAVYLSVFSYNSTETVKSHYNGLLYNDPFY